VKRVEKGVNVYDGGETRAAAGHYWVDLETDEEEIERTTGDQWSAAKNKCVRGIAQKKKKNGQAANLRGRESALL
jgi:hypothetical protein